MVLSFFDRPLGNVFDCLNYTSHFFKKLGLQMFSIYNRPTNKYGNTRKVSIDEKMD